MKRKLVVISTAILVLISLTIFLYINPKDSLQIGFVAGLSGKFADLGIDCRRGVERAIAKVNKSGGIKGQLVELIPMDDGQNDKLAIAAVKSLLDAEVPAIIGHATSSMTMTTLPIVNSTSTLLIGPTTSTSRLKDIDDNFIRSCAVSTASAAMMARYLYKIKGVKSAGIIYDLSNEAYTKIWYDSFKTTFLKEGGKNVEALTFVSSPDIQLLPIVQQMEKRSIDALVIIANSVDAAMLCQHVRKIGWQVSLAVGDWAATEQFINLGGIAVEGAIIQQFFNRRSSNPAYLEFKNNFEKLYKVEPGFGALHAYNAAMMVFRSMAEQQRGETLKQTILRISHFEGLQDDIVINKYGDSNHPSYMGVVRNGEFLILEDFGEKKAYLKTINHLLAYSG